MVLPPVSVATAGTATEREPALAVTVTVVSSAFAGTAVPAATAATPAPSKQIRLMLTASPFSTGPGTTSHHLMADSPGVGRVSNRVGRDDDRDGGVPGDCASAGGR